MSEWNLSDNNDLYWINEWGDGYFVLDNGCVSVKTPSKKSSINLYELTKKLITKGVEAPILFRFEEIIKDRISRLNQAFQNAIISSNYDNSYQLAYPIKVNHQKSIVSFISSNELPYDLGLEVGSKPEILAVLGISHSKNNLLLCNGYKDAEYIELALIAQKTGKNTIIIIEQFYELELVLSIANKMNIEANIGVRMKPSFKASSKWAESSGEYAKFGLDISQINSVIRVLEKEKKEHWLKLLHFHVGSQFTSILPFKKILKEAARVYVEIAKHCPKLSYFDVGGGLGIDYIGSKSKSDCSINYSIEEYAKDIVSIIGATCKDANVKDPKIISESGRAIIAQSSVLVTEVIDVSPAYKNINIDTDLYAQKPLSDLLHLYENINEENKLQSIHSAHYFKEHLIDLFMHGKISLRERALGEQILSKIMDKIHSFCASSSNVPEEVEKLKNQYIDLYFCNFSIFQSLPDFWAIKQLFPIMPIHRLEEKPTRRAIIVDLSCDSDGKLHKFISPKNPTNHIPLHKKNDDPYFIGIFLVGAYQEALGALHNLFGDTNLIHISLDKRGNWKIKEHIRGDLVKDVLSYFEYSSRELNKSFSENIERSINNGKLTLEESSHLKERFNQALNSYTYLMV